ncbi:AI-2E family transporter [Salinicoccus albus]|uniref:AI-2E family transporter n=1 Tax=Salinicoccus albus TaxID=418756 RepID=UPI00035CDCFD|nr:AI-2E family transporter [Salinicoccus albus]
MTNKNWFQTGIAIVISLLIIALILNVKIIFSPIFIILATILLPLILGGLLYYLTVPILRFLERYKFNRVLSIVLIFIIVLLVIAALLSIVVPMTIIETQNFMTKMPQLQRDFEMILEFVLSQRDRLPFDVQEYTDRLFSQLSDTFEGVTTGIITALANTIAVLLTLILVPFFFFFMLKDHEKVIPGILIPFKGKIKQFLNELLHDIDDTLRAFVHGQVLDSIILSLILYIGYSIIGLDYAILLALFALLMNLIPYIGPWIAFLPALLLALIQDPVMAVWVSIITLAAQIIDANFITPKVMGQGIHIHPLTVITVVLAAGNIAGIAGLFVAVPFYAVIKTIVQNIFKYRHNISDKMLKDI